MEIKVQDLSEMKIEGVSYCLEKECEPYQETYFNWIAYPMVNDMRTSRLTCGRLTAWHHVPEYTQVEFHEGQEVFYFTEGECIMIFCDLKDERVVMDSIQIARIQPGTEICVDAGKGHFVPIPLGERLQAVVCAPSQDAPRILLSETVKAIL